MNLQNSSEQVLDRISVDLYNKKVIVRGEEGTTLTFKCSSINEMFELKEKCGKLLKTEHFIVR
jgi:hypothetical protein